MLTLWLEQNEGDYSHDSTMFREKLLPVWVCHEQMQAMRPVQGAVATDKLAFNV